MAYAFSETICEIFQPKAQDGEPKLLSHAWLPDGEIKAVFLAIHGGMAHAGDWVTPALFFKDKGVASFALDMRWHGTYDKYNKNGKVFFHIDSYNEYVYDIHKYYLYLADRYPQTPIYIIGHSNGALIAMQYGLTLGRNADIKGFILSSPWLKNRVVVPKILMKMLRFLAIINPKLAVAPKSLTRVLTHDPIITERHLADEKTGLRGVKASVQLGIESQKSQNWVVENIHKWRDFPIFAVIAGQDHLADPSVSEAALAKIPQELVQVIRCDNNFHENFNELNREEIFQRIWQWIAGRL